MGPKSASHSKIISSGAPVSSVEDRNRGEVETRSEAQSPEGKSACNSAANPDFSTPFAALTTVEMTSFLQSNLNF